MWIAFKEQIIVEAMLIVRSSKLFQIPNEFMNKIYTKTSPTYTENESTELSFSRHPASYPGYKLSVSTTILS